MDASTAYITYEDSLKLLEDSEAFPTRVISQEYGWWIHKPKLKKLEEDEKLQQMRHDGYSDVFINLVKFAAKKVAGG